MVHRRLLLHQRRCCLAAGHRSFLTASAALSLQTQLLCKELVWRRICSAMVNIQVDKDMYIVT
jgi:hypothetical protein